MFLFLWRTLTNTLPARNYYPVKVSFMQMRTAMDWLNLCQSTRKDKRGQVLPVLEIKEKWRKLEHMLKRLSCSCIIKVYCYLSPKSLNLGDLLTTSWLKYCKGDYGAIIGVKISSNIFMRYYVFKVLLNYLYLNILNIPLLTFFLFKDFICACIISLITKFCFDPFQVCGRFILS